jgi:hypothetical protein
MRQWEPWRSFLGATVRCRLDIAHNKRTTEVEVGFAQGSVVGVRGGRRGGGGGRVRGHIHVGAEGEFQDQADEEGIISGVTPMARPAPLLDFGIDSKT